MAQLLPKLLASLAHQKRNKGDVDAQRLSDAIVECRWHAHNATTLLALARDLDLSADQVC